MLSKNSIYLLEKRYCRKGEKSEDVFKRVAEWIGQGDIKFEERAFDLMVSGTFLPNSPCLFNSPGGNLHACMTLGVEDDLDSIFQSLVQMARIFKSGGGVGINFSKLREKNAALSGGGQSSGMLSFMSMFNQAVETVKQGGIRRGALMGISNCSHPDIFDFIRVKLQGKLQNFNLSIMVDDNFMKRVNSNDKMDLISPKGYVVGSHKVKDVFELACFASWCAGDPAFLFYDRINKDNPFWPEIKIDTVNPSLLKGTRVLTSNGVFKIEDLEHQKNIFVPTLPLFGEDVEYHSGVCKYSGYKELYKITLRGTHIYYATKEHKWVVYRRGLLRKVETPDLKVGDWFPIAKQFDLKFGNAGSYDDGFMIGWLLGDGWAGKRKDGHTYFGFTFGNEESDLLIRKKIQKLLKEITNVDFQPKNPDIQVNCKAFINYMTKFGDINKSNGLPEFIWKEGSENFRRGLIDGIFSSDGWVRKNICCIGMNSAHEKLIRDIADLLGFYGIKSLIHSSSIKNPKFPNGKIYDRTYKSFELTINAHSINHFRSIFKFTHNRKQQNLQDLIFKESRKWNLYENFIKVISIEKTEIAGDVWDLTVNDRTHTFKLAHCITGNCSEVALPINSACCLGSINLSKFVWKNQFNFEKFADVCQSGMRFLSQMNKLSKYPYPAIAEAMAKYNPVGLGVMGFADSLIKLGIAYDSDDCLKFINELGKVYKKVTDEYEPDVFRFYRRIIAPTGSLSIIADCSSGIEPIYDTTFERHLTVGVIQETRDLYQSQYVRTAHQVSPEWHVKVLAQWQNWINGGCSKTVNLPYEASVDDIKKIYMMAWKLGCKGVTIYRDGCLGGQVLVSNSQSVIRGGGPPQKCNDDSCTL